MKGKSKTLGLKTGSKELGEIVMGVSQIPF